MVTHSRIVPEDKVAIITPSYGPDFELCRALNESVHTYVADATHYILVDKRDLGQFRVLEGPGTLVVPKEDLLPRSLVRIPQTNRWMSPWTIRPLSGWLVQQIAKIASVSLISERLLVLIDSDTYLVRDVDRATLVRDGKSRLFRASDGISPSMKVHDLWHKNACRLLGAPPDVPPMPDYISSIASWDRQLVMGMCDRVEATTGAPWHRAVSRTPQFSEFLLYGAFVDKVLNPDHHVWIDDDDRCLTYWDFDPLDLAAGRDFVAQLAPTDLAILVSSHSRTSDEVRASMRHQATGGALS